MCKQWSWKGWQVDTKQYSVVLATEDMTKLMKIVGSNTQGDVIRAAVIAFLQQHGVTPLSVGIKHGGDRTSGKSED